MEKLAALVPLPRMHLVRYGGCLAPHSHLRGSVIPTPRQQGLDGEETQRSTPYWTWARLLKRVFALEMGTCPWCQRGVLRLIAVITQGEVIRKILRHLKLSPKMFQTCGSATLSESERTINAREGSDDHPSAALPLERMAVKGRKDGMKGM